MTDARLAEQVVAAAIAKGLTITTAESCTGGMVAAAITDVAGSSAIFERGVVTYSNAAKVDLLGVLQDTLDAHGAVSMETATEMATGALARARADISVSVTGIAGPGGSEHKPEGRVCFAIAHAHDLRCLEYDFGPQGRAANRRESVRVALTLLLEAIEACPAR